jgi:hypothetical protein
MKKDLGKIVSSGTPTQRALLLAEVVAHANYTREILLTEDELRRLRDSFRSPKEIALYNKFNRLDRLISGAINVYQGGHYEALYRLTRLKGWLLYWDAIEEAEVIFNCLLLDSFPDDAKKRSKVAKNSIKGSGFIYGEFTVEDDGVVKLEVEKTEGERRSLREALDEMREGLIQSVTRQISWEKALLDVMEDEGFKVKTYKNIIKRVSDELKGQLGLWGRHSAENQEKYSSLGKIRKTRLQSLLLSSYNYEIDISKIEVNQADYDYFRAQHLTGAEYE